MRKYIKEARTMLKNKHKWSNEKKIRNLFLLRVAIHVEWILMIPGSHTKEEQYEIMSMARDLDMKLGHPTPEEQIYISEIMKVP